MAMNQHKLFLLCRPARRRSTLKLLMASSALIAAGVTGAQAQTWNVDANGNWGTASNWSPQIVPNSINAIAALGGAITADRTITLDMPIQLNELTFSSPTHSYTIAPSSGVSTLTFTGGANPSLNSTTTASQTIGADVVLNRTLTANIGASGDVAITGGVSGGSWLIKTGAGVLTLSGPGSYTGNTAVNAGTLRAGAANAFGPTSATTVAPGATLDLNGFNQAIGSLAGAGNITLGSANLTINQGATTFSGQISGDGGSLTSNIGVNARTILTGDNTYTGGTKVSSGQLQVGDFHAAGGAIIGPATIDNGALLVLYCNNAGDGGKCSDSTTGSGTFSGAVNNNGTLQTDGHGTLTLSGAITGGGEVITTLGTTVLTANNSYLGITQNKSGVLQVGAGGTTGNMGAGDVLIGGTLLFNRSNELIVNSKISGIGQIQQIGSGTTVLAADNDYTGWTSVAAGTLQVGNGTSSGSMGITSGITVSSGATLDIRQSDVFIMPKSIEGGGALRQSGSGTTIISNQQNYTGGTSITAGTLQIGAGGVFGSIKGDVSTEAGGTLAFNHSSVETFSGKISGGGAVHQIGAGALTLTGDNTYSGGTIIDTSRTLQIGDGHDTGALGDGPVRDDGSLIFNRTGVLTVRGAISGTGAVTQDGPGTTVLTDENLYFGDTTITEGALQLGDGGDTGTLRNTAKVDVRNGAALSFNRGNTLVFDRFITGAGKVNQDGVGTTVLTANSNYGGGTTISAGTLQLGEGGATGGISGAVTNNGALSFNRNNTLVLNGVISGTGKVSQDGIGKTVLTANNLYFGDTTITAGTLQLGDGRDTGTLLNTAKVDVKNDGALSFNHNNTLAFDRFITGAGKVNQDGVGTTVLTANNDYSGVTTISAGTLQLGAGGDTGEIKSDVVNNGALTFNRRNTLVLDGAITGSGKVTQAGVGTTVLTANNDYRGVTTISAGTLQLGAGGDTGEIRNTAQVTLQNGGALSFNRRNTLVFDKLITGVGKVNQDGLGTTVLTANNNYNGDTTINAGTLQLGDGGATSGISGAVTNNGALSFNRLNTLVMNGAITGSGKVNQEGVGTTVLTANNNYGGGTTISAGTLQLGDGGDTGSIEGNVANNGVLAIDRTGNLLLTGTITGSGSLYQYKGFTTLTGNNNYHGGTTIAAGVLRLGDGRETGEITGDVTNNGYLSFNRSNTLVFDGKISGDGHVAQSGEGTTVLRNNNTYSGGTTIMNGMLQLGDGHPSGALLNTTGVDIWDSGALSFNRDDRVVFDKAITGGGKLRQDGAGTTVLTVDNDNFLGETTISAGTLQLGDGETSGLIRGDVVDNGALSFNRSDALFFEGKIKGSGKVRQEGEGTTVLLANNDYRGGTTISAGTLQLGYYSETGEITGDVLNNGELSLFRVNLLTLDGVISGTGKLSQNGCDVAVLTGTNTYSGDTAITCGKLQLGDGGDTGTLLNTARVDNQDELSFNRRNTLVFDRFITGSGKVTQDGVGTTVLAANNDYSGGTTINAGALQLGNGQTTGSIQGDVTNYGALSFNRSNLLTFGGVISGSGKVTQDGAGITALTAKNLYFGDTTITAGTLQLGDGGTSGAILNTAKVDVRDNGALSFNRLDRVVFDRFITGAGKVSQDGIGTTVLTADNAYTGGTMITAGVLQLGDDGATGSIQGDVINNSALSFNRFNTLTFGGAISGSGKVRQDGIGTKVLTADNSYSGGTTIAAGTLQIGNGGAAGTVGSGPVVDDSVLAINRSGVFEIPGVISGVGRLDQMGPGTTILTGNNTYSGGTTISGGALQLGNGGTTGWIIGDVSNDGTLIFNRSDAVTFAPTISGAGGLIQMGSGSTNLTAINSYTGPTLVQAGKLSINGSITSDTTVLPGATLGGNGTIYGSVMNYGIVAPGNSIGQLNIVGSYTQAAGSFYQVELNPAGKADRIMVSDAPGTATIQGGTVAVQAVNGIYPLTYKYTIVTATGGVTGKYAGLTTNLAFLRPTITYDANNVYLEASVNSSLVDYSCGATTANQNAIATALNQTDNVATGDFANMIGALFGLNNNQGSAALDAMSGQPYSGFGTANIFSGNLFGSALRQQMVLGRQGGADENRRAVRTADGAPTRLSSWASGIGGTRSVAGGVSGGSSRICGGWTPNRTAGQVFNAGGMMGGLDYRVDPSTLIGLSIGGTGGNDWTKGFNGRGTSDNVTVATYVDLTSGAAYADLLTGYAYNMNRMTRQITIPGLGERTARGSTGAPQWFGQAEFGYRFGLGMEQAATSTVTPFARLEATTISQRAFTERDAEGLNLAVAGQRTSSLRSVLGAEFTTAWQVGWREPLGLQLRAGQAHDYANMTRPVKAAFAAAPGASFTIFGPAPPRDSATVGLRLWTMLDAGYMPFLRYDGDIARGADSHAINAGVRMNW